MDATQVLNLIESAFPVRPLPDMSLHQAHLANETMTREISDAEWRAAARKDSGRTWREFSEDELISCDAALAHLEESSFVYTSLRFSRALCDTARRNGETQQIHFYLHGLPCHSSHAV